MVETRTIDERVKITLDFILMLSIFGIPCSLFYLAWGCNRRESENIPFSCSVNASQSLTLFVSIDLYPSERRTKFCFDTCIECFAVQSKDHMRKIRSRKEGSTHFSSLLDQLISRDINSSYSQESFPQGDYRWNGDIW